MLWGLGSRVAFDGLCDGLKVDPLQICEPWKSVTGLVGVKRIGGCIPLHGSIRQVWHSKYAVAGLHVLPEFRGDRIWPTSRPRR